MSEDFNLLETEKVETNTQGPVDHMKALDQMRSQLSETEDPQIRQNILDATLDNVMDRAETDRQDLLSSIRDLTDYQESVGLDFGALNTLNDDEELIIAKAKSSLDKAIAHYDEVKIPPTGFLKKFWWNITGGESKVARAKKAKEAATKALENAGDQAKQMFRERIESADMEVLLTQYSNKSRVTCDQLKERETEFKQTEEGLKVAIDEASKVHVKALEKKAETETKLEETETKLIQEQDKLGEVTDKQSEDYANQLKLVTELEQKLEELKGLQSSYMALAASKDSFMHKHNLALKTLTVVRSNLQTHRAKLESDTKERIDYYQGYVMALKARTDQEFASILEKLGVKTDEKIGETLAAMFSASQKTLQDMMESIPEHERKMAEVYTSFAESVAIVRERDAEIKRNFEDNYGINTKELFEQYYSGDAGTPEPTPEAEPTKKAEPASDDLLA